MQSTHVCLCACVRVRVCVCVCVQSRQPCPMENQYHETEKTVFLAKKTVSFATRTIFQITLWQGKAMQRTA